MLCSINTHGKRFTSSREPFLNRRPVTLVCAYAVSTVSFRLVPIPGAKLLTRAAEQWNLKELPTLQERRQWFQAPAYSKVSASSREQHPSVLGSSAGHTNPTNPIPLHLRAAVAHAAVSHSGTRLHPASYPGFSVPQDPSRRGPAALSGGQGPAPGGAF